MLMYCSVVELIKCTHAQQIVNNLLPKVVAKVVLIYTVQTVAAVIQQPNPLPLASTRDITLQRTCIRVSYGNCIPIVGPCVLELHLKVCKVLEALFRI